MAVFCQNCGAANEDFAEFCASCGEKIAIDRKEKARSSTNQTNATQPTTSTEKKLYRSRDNKMLTGLSAGLAKYFDMEVDIVRLLWVVFFVISGGVVLIVYLIMAMAIPLEPETTTTSADKP
ncbi:MAG: PspC domain-containing protein [Asgard group archaeon]|nr:PspC domain-containing protein [Asgard group archaeon]